MISSNLYMSLGWGALIALITLGGLTIGVKILFHLNATDKIASSRRKLLTLVAFVILIAQFLLSGIGLHYSLQNGLDSFGVAGGMIGGILIGFAVVKFFEPESSSETEKVS